MLDERGDAWYVKRYADPDEARGEHLALRLYAALGVPVPVSVLVQIGGSVAVANARVVGRPPAEGELRRMAPGFAADVFLHATEAVAFEWSVDEDAPDFDDRTAPWHYGNALLDERSGAVIRIDAGGSLLWGLGRGATGALPNPPDNALACLRDWRARDGWSLAYQAAFGAVTDEDVRAQVAALRWIMTDERIDAEVAACGFEPPTGETIRRLLRSRRDAMAAF